MENQGARNEPSFNLTTHGFQKIDGLISLARNKVLLEEGLRDGDAVVLFLLPNEKYLLGKAEGESDLRIEKITSAYISFEGEIVIREV